MMSFRPLSVAIRQSARNSSSALGNGVKVASESADGETACVQIHIDAGSRNENEANSGASHVLTQLTLQGAQKRIQSLGGRITANVSQEKTVFSAQVFQKDVPQAMELLSDMVQKNAVSESDLAAQRDALLTGRDAASREYACRILDHVHGSAFSGTGMGRNVMGTEETLARMTAKDLAQFAETHYTPDRVFVSAAGAVKHDAIADLAGKHFGGMKGSAPAMEAAIFTGSDKRIRFDSMKEASVTIAFQGVAHNSHSYLPAMLMKTILGSWSRSSPAGKNGASKLARELSDSNFVHSFSAFNTCYKDTGLFGIQLTAADNTLDNAMWYVMDNMVRLCHNVTEEELVRAKVQLKAEMLAQKGTHAGACADMGNQLTYTGKIISNEELCSNISKVSLEQVKAAANHIINDEDHVLAAVGPIYELPDYNWIRRRSYWHRY